MPHAGPLVRVQPGLAKLLQSITPPQTEGLTEYVVHQLKDSIMQGLIKPGERLPPERQLAELLQISRGSLRQALKALQIMGVLRIVHGSGAYLSDQASSILREPDDVLLPLRGHSFAEMFEARRAMEAEAAACAALRANERDIEKLRAILQQMKSTGHVSRFAQRDKAFHRQIALASGNSVFVWFTDMLQKVLSEGHIVHARSERLPVLVREHQRVLTAIESRDPQRAREQMLEHLNLANAYTDEEAGIELRVVPVVHS